MRQGDRILVRGDHALAVCQEVMARGLHPENVDVDTGDHVVPLVLDDRHHLLMWMRLYSRCLAARNLFWAGAVKRCLWEIDAGLLAATEAPSFLDGLYLTELRNLLLAAQRAIIAGEINVEHHGPYVALTTAQNLCVTRMIRREAYADVPYVRSLPSPRRGAD
jgi:hypothetical protein